MLCFTCGGAVLFYFDLIAMVVGFCFVLLVLVCFVLIILG